MSVVCNTARGLPWASVAIDSPPGAGSRPAPRRVATCVERGEDSWPRPNSPVPLRVEHAELHGAWGLNITWNDGHATGIYPFDLLRRWHEAGG
jgi:hypothetical protein